MSKTETTLLKFELKAANFTNETVTQKMLNKKHKPVPCLKLKQPFWNLSSKQQTLPMSTHSDPSSQQLLSHTNWKQRKKKKKKAREAENKHNKNKNKE